MKEEKISKTTINNWNFGEMLGSINIGWLVKLMILLIVVSSLTNTTHVKTMENRDVYNSCTESCKMPSLGKHTMKFADKEFLSVDLDELASMPSCVESCNNMYLRLRGK